MKPVATLAVSMLVALSCGDGTHGQVLVADESIPDSPTSDWPAFGFDRTNSVHNRSETLLGPGNVHQLKESWRIDDGAVTGTPIVVGGVVYFADWNGTVHAVEAADGSSIWRSQIGEVPISSTVAVTEELVIAGDLGGVLHALDRVTGDTRWSIDVNPVGASLFASPVVVDDMVVVGMTDAELGPDQPEFRGAVVAYDLDDGSERWRFRTDPDDDSEHWVPVWSTVAYDPDRGLLFVGTGDTNQPGSGGPGSGVERAQIDLPLADGVLALDHRTGEVAWFFKLVEEDKRRDFDVGASPNLFTIDGRDVVGVGGKSGEYVVLDRDTGEEVWKTPLTRGSALGGVMTTAAVGDGAVYVASNDGGSPGIVFALEAGSGSVLWQQSFGPPIVGSMALANGVLYRGTFSPAPGTVFALDAADGTVLWTDEVDGRLAGGFSIAGGRLFVGYGSGSPPQLKPEPGGLIAYALP